MTQGERPALGQVIRETAPLTAILETAVIATLTGFAVLGAPVAVLVTCGLLFGVVAPALGILLCWSER